MTVQMQKAIQYLKEQKREYGTPSIFADYCDLAIECIEKQSKTDWIPCEERLPSESGRYLVTTNLSYENPRIFTYSKEHHSWKNEIRSILNNDCILAWQPLPKPYKKEGAE